MDSNDWGRLSKTGRDILNKATVAGRDLPRPRVHGNGFVQLDTKPDGSERLHIWGHRMIPQQEVRTGIHDHTYTVHSRVLSGEIVDITWGAVECDADESSHEVFRARPRDGQDTELVGGHGWVQAQAVSCRLIGEVAGSQRYTVLPGMFHSTIVGGPAATLMVKGDVDRKLVSPRILVPTGMVPDNSFSRNAHPTSLLWGIIDEVYPNWRDLL